MLCRARNWSTAHPTTAAPHISITQLEEAVAAQHATNEEAMEKETMEKEPHLTQMRLALTDISSDPAELCALPQMITLTAQGIAEAAKGRQNQRTEELQREMRSLAFKKMWWKLDKLMMMMMILVIVTYISWPL
jgi:hypothetical protein